MNLSENFWDKKYENNNIGWDIGEISTPIKAYIDQLTSKDLKILIPGGGNSYEAEYLHKKGFKNVFVVDISKTALKNFKNRVPAFPDTHIVHKDFFELKMKYDLIIEQTFFCALNPILRSRYAQKMTELLKTKGKLVGLFFNIPLNENHPPFGGDKNEYLNYFQSSFNILIMDDCINSVESRKGTELFFKLQTK